MHIKHEGHQSRRIRHYKMRRGVYHGAGLAAGRRRASTAHGTQREPRLLDAAQRGFYRSAAGMHPC